VSLRSRRHWRLSCGMIVAVGLACLLVGCLAGRSYAQKTAAGKSAGNSKCYVCHATMKEETITASHLERGVTCDECHGASIEHMHDEMLMTKPDLLFGRLEVVGMCGQCHEKHEDPAAVAAFQKKWIGRARANGRTISSESVCTDCHGKHNLAKVDDEFELEQAAQWITAFNGRDLDGWSSFNADAWSVKAGRIFATAGPDGKGESLWSEALYEDYQLAVTFGATEPIHAGIWLRGRASEPGARVEIFQSDKPQAFTGSVFVPGRGLVLVNLRRDLFDSGGWNTLAVKVEADRVQVWLNAEEIGSVRIPGPAKGKIGFYIENQTASKPGEFTVREVLIQSLAKPEKSDN